MTGTCIVIGGSSGIGRMSALMAATHGYDVAVAAPVDQGKQSALVAEQIRGLGRRALAIDVDVRDEADLVNLFDRAHDSLGTLSAVVNAAGVAYMTRTAEMEQACLMDMLQINTAGVMLSCREAVRRMSTARGYEGGAIVNVSSMAATIGGRPGASLYAASKAAVDAYTVGLAREVAKEGIRVNAVRPGVVATPMTAHLEASPQMRKGVEDSIPMGRLATADEIAHAIVWLLSSHASFVTGALLDVSGGGFTLPTAA